MNSRQKIPKRRARTARSLSRFTRGLETSGEDRKIYSYEFHFFPNSNNVTVAGSGSYIAGQGIFIGPGASALDASAAIVTAFDDLPSVSDLQELYDVFRITEVEYQIVPLATVQPNSASLSAASTVTVRPQFMQTVIDLDDATPLSTVGQALQYQTYRFARPTEVTKRRYCPRIAREVFDGVTPSFEEPDGPVWIDVAQTSTPHYGLKLWVDTAGASANCQNEWRIWGRMKIDFKRVR
jgi:hypothetical protein